MTSRRPPTLLALPSYLAGNVAMLGNRSLVGILKQHGLGLAQFSVLVALLDFGKLAPHELATRLQTDRSHISSYVEALMKRGWVNRVPDEADRRRVMVGLTAEGHDLVGRLSELAAESEVHVMDALSAAEQHTLRALLIKLLEAAEVAEPSVSADS